MFAEESHSVEDDLHVCAIELKATCVRHPIDTMWRYLPHRNRIHLVFASKDEERNVTRASAVHKACGRKGDLNTSVYAVCSLRGADTLFNLGAISTDEGTAVPVRCIDWTRNVIEQTLMKHPLFLLDWRPLMREPKEVLENSKRHVVVVGAGHVGMEFLRLALSVSRDCAPKGGVPLSYRFDVFDNQSDAKQRDECRAMHRFAAETSGRHTLEDLSCEFHLCDALSDAFLEELDGIDGKHGGITYVFVSLGDDFATAQVVQRIREHFKRKREGINQPEPAIVAVLDDEELCGALAKAKRGNFKYGIETMGAPKDMYKYEMVSEESGSKECAADEDSERARRLRQAEALRREY